MNALAWKDFANATPKIAAEGKRLLNQFGIGLAFIATTRKDGSPRLHPCVGGVGVRRCSTG
ncbi:MAG TPA: hypothetical protein VFG38_20360 [Pseudomonadales bacterium]|nr:hypothetical protein [Pseudomonadales bacterium]